MRYYADKMGVTNAHITPMVDGLVSKGYAKRGRTLADHRMVLLQLTDKGRENINKVLKI